jgi:hypothetical protein
MTTKAEREAANVSHTGDVFIRATVTSAEVCAIPAAWSNKFVEFSAMGADVYIRFGTADTVSCDYTTVSSRDGTTEILTATTSGPHLIIPAGTSKHERVDSGWSYFAHKDSSASGYLYATLATGDKP